MDTEKLNRLAKMIQEQTETRVTAGCEKYGMTREESRNLHFRDGIQTHIRPGRKYTKIDVGTSGKYMIDNNTGEIFGIKGYGMIHRGHRYGTLNTIDEWDWSDFTAVSKAAKIVTPQ